MDKNTETHDERWNYHFLTDVLRWLNTHDSEFTGARIQDSGIALYDTYDQVDRQFHSLKDLREWLGY